MIQWPIWRRRRFVPPPLMHITHGKAGSTWVDRVLRQLYGKQVSPRLYELPARFDFSRHRVFSAVFITRDEFLRHPELRGIHRFVVIRDLRDTLVSNYFSLRDTHELDPGGVIAARRQSLRDMSVEDGMKHLIDHAMSEHAEIQRTWAESDAPLLKYEELIIDDLAIFQRLLCETFGHEIQPAELKRAVESSRFEAVFQRKLGVTDATSHGRQGTAGDWKNHFTPELRRYFHEKLGSILLQTGYEKDAQWVTAASA
jgi:lipopolysaccharide transport system ATP-binding protein